MPKSGKGKSVAWSERARTDLERIFDHIAEDFTHELAKETVELLISEVGTLSIFPRKGSISILYHEIRELIVGGNTVYYRNNESDIVIAAIRPRRTR
jgi:plasmid stabilization system protein ParE